MTIAPALIIGLCGLSKITSTHQLGLHNWATGQMDRVMMYSFNINPRKSYARTGHVHARVRMVLNRVYSLLTLTVQPNTVVALSGWLLADVAMYVLRTVFVQGECVRERLAEGLQCERVVCVTH